MLGYSNIPDYWKKGLQHVEDVDFKYTSISLLDVYEMGNKQAIQNIERNGGSVTQDNIIIKPQRPVAVKFEKGFKNHVPAGFLHIDQSHKLLNNKNSSYLFEFQGVGFVVKGRSEATKNISLNSTDAPEIAVYVDSVLIETVIPTGVVSLLPDNGHGFHPFSSASSASTGIPGHTFPVPPQA